ncbi:TldD/PmbA family protein [Actinomadura logoneensis]|uniref:TldD/PmbA family protein n=1 Tax=Actinomadura logoneensis TaxID=2293572 RepID=A0A372JDN1_9ACTN|nr:metallopeptidase TldD-related protein [Actinomadura logoneensis]RFU38115.1 TldD/PmbA family protein [Actinomadura logoneensis]
MSGWDAAESAAERALAASRADGCAVIVDGEETAQVRWAENAVTTAGLVRDQRITVVAFAAGRQGTATAAVTRHGDPADDVARLVAEAERAARESPASPDAMPLLAPDETRGDSGRASGSEMAADSCEQDGGAAWLTAFGGGLKAAVARAREDRHVLFGYAEHAVRTTYLATSTGVRARHRWRDGLIDLTARDARDERASAWGGIPLPSTGPFDATAALACLRAELAERVRWAGRRAALPPKARGSRGGLEVLFSPSCVADLLLYLYEALDARDALEGASPFATPDGMPRIGERLAAPGLTLRSDPAMPGLECAPFAVARAPGGTVSVFDNGFPLEPTRWLDDGALTALVQTRHSAKASGLPVTPRIGNLRLEGPSGSDGAEGSSGGRTLRAMVADTERGLLVNSLWYLRPTDPRTLALTGSTRDGVYLVERGEVVGALDDFRFSEQVVPLLARVTEVGRALPALAREWDDTLSRTAVPPLRVEGVTAYNTR